VNSLGVSEASVQAQGDDQRCDGDLLKIDSQHIDNAERHRERNGYGQSHDQSQTPLPKSKQRNNNDENDGFDKGPQEQVDVLLDLERLVGCVRKNQVGWKNLAKVRKLRIHGPSEACDLLLIAHVDR